MSRQTQAMKELSEIIRAETAVNGILSFARFMELALYCPVHGYYEAQKDNIGRGGDFITSISIGGLFGQLLAFQFAGWLEQEVTSQKSEVRIIEAGAHDGKLAKDILNWLQLNRPKLFAQLEYYIIEPSGRRQEWQKETLKQFVPRVRWFTDFEDLKLKTENSKPIGIIFSNELLDAMPVHRFGWDAKNKKWFEWGVAVEGGKFVWARMPEPVHDSRFTIQSLKLESVLPDNYIIEISPAAENWWRETAGVLERGKLLAIDYGFAAAELFSPARAKGSLRAYFHHHASNDILANVGGQDLTAHVNFSAIQKAGEDAGLTTESFSTQAKFLTKILEKTLQDRTFGGWSSSRTRQFQTLTHPEHLGRAFLVLVQAKT
jgi:SAM-dependent MidA family methyltransferase